MATPRDNKVGVRQLTVESPIGPLVVVATAVGVRRIYFPHLTDGERSELERIETDQSCEILAHTQTQLVEYFAGKRQHFDICLDLVGTQFQQMAWRALADVSFGNTATYGQQAMSIGRPKAVRAVGGANKMNPVPIVLPCHRIIGSNGALTGFAGGIETKKWLLQHEQDVVLQNTQR